jgi:hypothetical protein
MATGFWALPCAGVRQQVAMMWGAECAPRRSVPVCETALRCFGDYRCTPPGTYCAQRIHAGPGIAPCDGWSRSCADRWGRWLERLAGWSRLAVGCARPGLKTDVTDRDPRTRAELEVRRVYEPSRLAAAYVSAAYAQVVPRRQRTTRSSSALTAVSPVADVRAETVEAGARRAG